MKENILFYALFLIIGSTSAQELAKIERVTLPIIENQEDGFELYLGNKDGNHIFANSDKEGITYNSISANDYSIKVKKVPITKMGGKTYLELDTILYSNGFLYESYYSSYKEKEIKHYLFKRDPLNYELLESISYLLNVNNAEYSSVFYDRTCIDNDGLVVYEKYSSNIYRFDLDLKKIWKVKIPSEHVSPMLALEEGSVIISSIITVNGSSSDPNLQNKLSLLAYLSVTIVNLEGKIQSLKPIFEESFEVKKRYLHLDGSTLTGIFPGVGYNSVGVRFYNWDIETGEVLNVQNSLFNSNRLINDDLMKIGKMICNKPDTTHMNQNFVRYEFCKELNNNAGHIICMNMANYLGRLFESTHLRSKLTRCNVLFRIDKKGKLVWLKPNIFGSQFPGHGKGYALTQNNKLISNNVCYPQNFEGDTYDLKYMEGTIKFKPSNISFFAVRNLETGTLEKVVPYDGELEKTNEIKNSQGEIIGIISGSKKKKIYRYVLFKS